MEKAESIKKIHDHIDENFTEHLNRCREFLRQKSISASAEGMTQLPGEKPGEWGHFEARALLPLKGILSR